MNLTMLQFRQRFPLKPGDVLMVSGEEETVVSFPYFDDLGRVYTTVSHWGGYPEALCIGQHTEAHHTTYDQNVKVVCTVCKSYVSLETYNGDYCMRCRGVKKT